MNARYPTTSQTESHWIRFDGESVINDSEPSTRVNRKRTRHRPSRSQKRNSSIFQGSSTPDILERRDSCICMAFSPPPPPPPSHNHSRHSSLETNKDLLIKSCISAPVGQKLTASALKQFDGDDLDRRMFGGVPEDSQSAQDLRGPMLGVVLSLFNNVDFIDPAF
jgi:hypothetical protein